MAWALQIVRKLFTTWPGRTLATPAFRIEFFGIELWPLNIPGTTLRASESMAARPEGRMLWVDCCFTLNSTRQLFLTPGVTTTGWIRFGGMSSGWAGRSVHNIRLRQ